MNIPKSLQIEGFIEPQFKSLQHAFNSLFIEHGETGAAVAVYQNQKLVAHLYGANHSENGSWHEHHRVCTMSSCKGPLALCILLLVYIIALSVQLVF